MSAQPDTALGDAPAQPDTVAGDAAVPADAAAQRKAQWRAPGLDGVRALAVLAVLAFHENWSWIPGGFLGVDVFFVLSGYLITDLLAAKFRKEGRVGLNTFWQRRARRLLPALALMLVTVTAAVAILEPDQRASLRPALLGAVTYTSNWWQAFTRQSYFMLYGPPPPLQHLWSLAVEEQFYVLWPLILTAILLLTRRRLVRAAIAWGGALTSALVMLALYVPGSDPSRVYYGADTHASALLIGAALALTWPLATVAAAAKPMRTRLDIAGLAGLAVLVWAMWHFSGPNPALYPFGLVLAALAAGGLVLAAASPGIVGRLASVAPMRWLGIRSYGIYLWHWPVIAITVGIDERAAGSIGARTIDALLPIGLAAVSWRWLESPILSNGLLSELARRRELLLGAAKIGWRKPTAATPLVVSLALLTVVGVAGYGIVMPQTGPTLQQQITAGAHISAVSQSVTSPDAAYAWWTRPTAAQLLAGARVTGQHRTHGRSVRVNGADVIAIGDSVMLASAPELATAFPGIYINAKISRAMIAGVALVQQLAAEHRLRPILIVALGTNGPVALDQIRQLHSAIGRHRLLVLVNVFEARPWEHEVNVTLADAAGRLPNVLLVNWHNAIEHHTNLLWSDGIHPMPLGGRLYARVIRLALLAALRGRAAHPAPAKSNAIPNRVLPGDLRLSNGITQPARASSGTAACRPPVQAAGLRASARSACRARQATRGGRADIGAVARAVGTR